MTGVRLHKLTYMRYKIHAITSFQKIASTSKIMPHYSRSTPNDTDEDITIETVLKQGDTENETKCMTCQIMALQPPLEEDAQICKKRRRMVLGDEYNCILAFVMRSKPIRLVEGNTYLVSDFRVTNNAITIHNNSIFEK